MPLTKVLLYHNFTYKKCMHLSEEMVNKAYTGCSCILQGVCVGSKILVTGNCRRSI